MILSAVLFAWSANIFAQTTTLACSPASTTAAPGRSVTFTATGGDGNYVWSGQNLNVSNPTGSQFMVSYPNPGTYVITAASAGQTANCSVTVAAASGGTATTTPGFPNTGGGFGY